MKVKFRGKELELHYSIRMYLLYENIMNKPFRMEDMQSIQNILVLFYCSLISTLKYNKLETDVSFDEFADFIDETGDSILLEFANWFIKITQNQQEPLREDKEDKKKVSKGKKS